MTSPTQEMSWCIPDAPTTLPGIHALRELIHQQLTQASRQPFDVLTVMIDDYALVLGSLGWRVADSLAHMVSSILDGSTFGLFQLSTDSYALFIFDRLGKSLEELAEIVQRVAADAQRGMRDSADIAVSVSVGMLAVSAQTQTGADRLVDKALAAGFLARARRRQGTTVVDADADLEEKIAPLRWAMRIRQSIERDQLVLFAQPIKPLRQLISGPPRQEILVRLRDGDGTLWQPGDFLPIADRFGLTPDIDKWVIKNTFAWLGEQRRAGGRGVVNTSINLSGTSACEPWLVEYVLGQLDANNVEAREVCFEITESVGIAGFQHATQNITELRRRGFRFALDDFGSGMASLRYLRDLPLDYLKIDGSFVRDVRSNPANQYLLGAIRDMARAFALQTIAEYVEDLATVDYLARAGIDYAQGYALGKPMPLGSTPSSHLDSPV